MEVESIENVRRASDLTMDRGTACVAWSLESNWSGWSMIADILHPDHFDPPVGRAVRSAWLGAGSVARAVDRGVSKLTSTDSRGVVDFRTGGCLLTGRKLGFSLETYSCPGSTVVRRSHGKGWDETREQPGFGLAEYTPVWLVELPRGVTEATAQQPEMLEGVLCRRLRARCDLGEAARQSRHGMQLPDFAGPDARAELADVLRDQRSAPTELWIDGSGCLRRVRVSVQIGEPDEILKETTGFVANLRLCNLGTAAPIAPPAAAKQA